MEEIITSIVKCQLIRPGDIYNKKGRWKSGYGRMQTT
jgi:hypothetical protein